MGHATVIRRCDHQESFWGSGDLSRNRVARLAGKSPTPARFHERVQCLCDADAGRYRLYIQVEPQADVADWPDHRIWDELRIRLARDDGWTLHEGPVLEKNVAPIRSFVVEPMHHGRLFLAGDAAHIVPATGAKGLNLAVHDVRILARAIAHWYRTGSAQLLDGYSAACLSRVWRVQEFSSWMSSMLHRLPDSEGFFGRLQRAQLQYVCSSDAGARCLAENYVGLPHAPG